MLAPLEPAADIEGQQGERRGGARQRLMLRTAKLRCRSGEYACVIHDVSETGARLRLFHAHPPECHMFLELANGELYAIERRWTDGLFAGCRFASPIEVADFLHEKNLLPRRPLRLHVAHPARIAGRGTSGHAMLANLSQHGACIEAGAEIPRGAPLRIEIPGAAPRLGHVCWRKAFRHGVAFQEALTLEAFAQLAYELQPYEGEANAAPAALEDTCAASA